MKKVLPILTIILALATLLIARIFVNRLTLSYNSEGRYFDESSLTVYHEQAAPVYGVLLFIGFALTLLAVYKTIKVFHK